jgi:carbonic anhydrase
MKKLMLVVAMLAVVLVAAAPAIAQVTQGFKESGIKSGSASPKVEIKNSGNGVNECGPIQQIAQTGNVLNEQGVTQYNDTTADISFDGSTINVGTADAPATIDSVCTQTTNQAAAS